jgi:hypothetical protein
MNKEQLKKGDYIQSDSGKFAYVDKILPSKVRVWIDGQKDYILNEQLSHWSYANPIKDNRIILSKTFAIRFKQFLEWVPAYWITSQPHYMEEFEFMDKVADYLLNYQIQTVTDKEEIEYLKRLGLL